MAMTKPIVLQLLVPRPRPVESVFVPNEDVLQATIAAAASVPLFHCNADRSEVFFGESVGVGVRPKDFQANLLGHLCLDSLPITKAFSLFYLNHEAVGVIAFLLMKAECKPPAACRTGIFLATDISCQIFALGHGARGQCAHAWMPHIGKLWVARSLTPCIRVVSLELLDERICFQC